MESQVSKKLSTMLPLDVFMAFTEFCKTNALTGLNKFDYGVGLRILLMKAQYADMLFDIDERVRKLEDETNTPEPNGIPAGFYEEKVLGTKTNGGSN